ncbi:hypothetical protein Tco_1552807, partial [Tanacetum coccineum]
ILSIMFIGGSACTSEIAEDFDTCRFKLRRISLTGFPVQSVGSSNVDALDSSYLLVLIIRTSQSRQPDKSESVNNNFPD